VLSSVEIETTEMAEGSPESQNAPLVDNYRLTYFNFRGVAEPIRFIFKLKGIPFEDVRLEKDETWITVHKQSQFVICNLRTLQNYL